MKIEEAMERLDQTLKAYADEHNGFVLLLDDLAVRAVKAYIEANRWRKLAEEKPPVSRQEYEIYVPSEACCDKFQSDIWWGDGWSEGTKYVSHWREHIGPEEEQ